MDALNQFFSQIPFAAGLKVALQILLVLVITFIIARLGNKLLSRVLSRGMFVHDQKRKDTTVAVMLKVWKTVIYFTAAVVILGLLGVNIMPIIASAGIVGLAVAFGAQSIVSDVISGFFVIFDNYYSVGDYIETNGVSGKVEEFGLRSTKIRDWGGEYHIIPNGKIAIVTNYSKGALTTYLPLSLPYDVDLGSAIAVVKQACADMAAEDFLSGKLIAPPQYLGIDKLSGDRVDLMFCFKMTCDDQAAVKRAVLQALHDALQKEGIATLAASPVRLAEPQEAKDHGRA